ncbi:melanocortin receptor 5-like [Nematostella vectensis]|uniref:melanocortin receptor 5-like n=1 Tax=Nematostella vectensis TaxID=45351 RepID=UPI0013904FBE|nr:melanocortin receptor 5-like [Nematostella vectensis]
MSNSTLLSAPEWESYFSVVRFSIVFLSFLAVGTVLVNGIALLAIYKDPLRCFRTPLTIFITGILISNMATGLFVEPYFAVVYSMLHFTNELADESYMTVVRSAQVISSVTINASFLTLLALAIAQLISLYKPQIYEKWITRTASVATVAAIWIYVVVFSLLPEIFTMNIGLFFLVDLALHNTLLTVALISIYIGTFIVFHKAVQRSEIANENQNNRPKAEKEFIKGTFILTMLLILTVWPFSIALYIWLLRPYSSVSKILQEQIALYLCDNILFLKFLWDPVVFIWRVPKYRQSVVLSFAGILEKFGCVQQAGQAVSYRRQHDDITNAGNNEPTVVIEEGTVGRQSEEVGENTRVGAKNEAAVGEISETQENRLASDEHPAQTRNPISPIGKDSEVTTNATTFEEDLEERSNKVVVTVVGEKSIDKLTMSDTMKT